MPAPQPVIRSAPPAAKKGEGAARQRARKPTTPLGRARGEGAHRALFAAACARHPGNPQAQFATYLAGAVMPAATGRRREVSDKTRTDYGDTLKALPALLRALRRPLQNASELGRAHVLALLRHWEQQGHAEGTIQWRLSLLRRFFTLVGRPQVLPAGAAWHAIVHAQGIRAGTLGRRQVATVPKGWRDRGVEPLALIESIRLQHPVVASQLDLCLWFGLRKNEALQIRPQEADCGTHLNVVEGTKGGKPRSVAFSSDPVKAQQQRAVLERARQLAARHPRGILAIAGMRLQQSRSHVNYVLRKFAITRKGLGVTQHGLRHQFGCDLFTELTGLPAPVLASAPAAAYCDDAAGLLAARRTLSRQMGHERPSITAAYIGSVPQAQADAQERLRGWRAAMAGLRTALDELQVLQAWIVGNRGLGLAQAGGEPLQLALRVPPAVLARASLEQDLARFAAAASHRLGVSVLPLLTPAECASCDALLVP